MLNADQAVMVGVPPALKGRYYVRVVDAKFGLSKSSGNPMVTLSTEIAGVPVAGGGVTDSVERGGQKYIVAGLQLKDIYFPLIAGKALGRFIAWLKEARLYDGQPIDDENHDCSPYKGLVMEAIISSTEEVQREVLTPEQKEAGQKEGNPILDNDGNPITKSSAFILEWRSKYDGEVGPF